MLIIIMKCFNGEWEYLDREIKIMMLCSVEVKGCFVMYDCVNYYLSMHHCLLRYVSAMKFGCLNLRFNCVLNN